MLIAIDIGNSSINIGFFIKSGLLIQNIDTWPRKTSLEYLTCINEFIKEKNINKIPKGIIISSVVSGHSEVFREALKKLTSMGPLMVSYKIKTGLKFKISNPEELGSDRIANAVAAYEHYKCPVMVVDFGTATTISVVGKDADYIGGTIIPGIRLMNEALAKGTSKLTEVPLAFPEFALGTDTTKCIQSGLFFGTAGAIERILTEIEKEVGLKLKVVITGGFGSMITKILRKKHELRPYLTLEGLQIIYTRNTNA
jgi:type III pantothenate kinase